MLLHRIFNDYRAMLVDPLAVQAFPEALGHRVLLPPGLENASHLMPWLLDLTSMGAAAQRELVEWIEHQQHQHAEVGIPSVGALLDTELAFDQLTYHLKRRLVITLGDQQRYLMRYYDPRVFVHLSWILTPDQMECWLGPVKRWTCWHEDGWRHIESATTHPGQALQLTADQSAHLTRLSAINQTLDQLQPVPYEDWRRRARDISGYVERAQAYGWASEKDWVSFAVLCASYHPAIDAHPRIADCIASLERDASSFSDAIALFSPDALQAITDELDLSTHQRQQAQS